MDLAAYLGSVITIAALALGAMYFIVSMVSKRIDRLETQNDAIIGALGDLGQRVARLEAHDA